MGSMKKNRRDENRETHKRTLFGFLVSFGSFLLLCMLLASDSERAVERYNLNFLVMILAAFMSIYYLGKLVKEHGRRRRK